MRAIAIILIFLASLANAQTPTPSNYLVQSAKWKFLYSQWFTNGAYFSGISKYSNQMQVLVRDSVTHLVGYKYIQAGATWGSITGTLSNQSDLQAALDAKQATISAGNGIKFSTPTLYVDTTKIASLHGNTWGNGMFMGSTNNRSVRWRTNNVQRMVLDSSGILGIGTSSPAAQSFGYPGIALYNSGSPAISFANPSSQTWLLYKAANLLRFYNSVVGETLQLGDNGNITIGSVSSISRLAIPIAPTASPNYGLVSLGSGAFDGSTSGYFTGSANGTLLAGNLASGSTSDLINLQTGGSGRFKVSSTGAVTLGNAGTIGTGSNYTLYDPFSGLVGYNAYNYHVFATSEGALTTRMEFGARTGFYVGQLAADDWDLAKFKSGSTVKFTVGKGDYSPAAVSTAYNGLTLVNSYGSTDAASGAYKPVNVTYTINNTGSSNTATATGIFLNATETSLNGMTHNLMDLQVGSVSKIKADNTGGFTAVKYYVSALNSAPSSASDTGTTGEIRFVSGYIYLCVSTNSWQRVALAAW